MMHILGRSRLDQAGHLLPHPRLQPLPRWPAEPLPRIVAMRRRPFSGAQPGSAVTGQLKGYVASFFAHALVLPPAEERAGVTAAARRVSRQESPSLTSLAFPVLAWLAVTPAQAPCEGWTTPEFWGAVDPVTVRACITYGYSLDAGSSPTRQTPLHWAAAFSDNPEVIRALVEAGASLEASTWPPEGRTPLHYAARYGRNPKVVRTLLEYGADVYAENPPGRTPLHLAALFNDNPAVVAELARTTYIDVRTKAGGTPLHDAVGRNGMPQGGPRTRRWWKYCFGTVPTFRRNLTAALRPCAGLKTDVWSR